jgi:hypothetical protein
MNKKPPTVNQVAREKRAKQKADVFTPPRPVNEILDKLPPEMWEPQKDFCDPTCGDGDMLVEVLHRKLQKGHNPHQALSTIYGIDIMADKVEECRLRLLRFVSENGYTITRAMIAEVLNHIVATPVGKKYPRGPLDYDFRFATRISEHDEEVDRWMHSITNGNQPRSGPTPVTPPAKLSR